MDHLSTLIREAIGEASLCWEPKPTGVFDSSRALMVSERIERDIRAWIQTNPTAHGKSFEKDLERLINYHSLENGSDTPDYILAQFMHSCLLAFNEASMNKEAWLGRAHKSKPATPCPTCPPTTQD